AGTAALLRIAAFDDDGRHELAFERPVIVALPISLSLIGRHEDFHGLPLSVGDVPIVAKGCAKVPRGRAYSTPLRCRPIARCISPCESRSAIACRLSAFLRPTPIPSWTFTLPSLK